MYFRGSQSLLGPGVGDMGNGIWDLGASAPDRAAVNPCSSSELGSQLRALG